VTTADAGLLIYLYSGRTEGEGTCGTPPRTDTAVNALLGAYGNALEKTHQVPHCAALQHHFLTAHLNENLPFGGPDNSLLHLPYSVENIEKSSLILYAFEDDSIPPLFHLKHSHPPPPQVLREADALPPCHLPEPPRGTPIAPGAPAEGLFREGLPLCPPCEELTPPLPVGVLPAYDLKVPHVRGRTEPAANPVQAPPVKGVERCSLH